MSTFILIHGSWHGAWCWYKVVPRLEAAGHRVIAIDLPGHGRDWTPPGEVKMENYVRAIGVAIEAQGEPVVLVAHSRGGIAMSQAAEAYTQRVSRLIYLAAFLIGDGETIVPHFMSDTDSLIMPNLILDRDAGWDMLKSDAFRPALYADCSDDDVSLASALLTPEPARPTATPMHLSERWARIPRSYIHLRSDKAVSSALQQRMFTAIPCERVVEMDTSHSAYFSAPDELTRNLIDLAR